MNRCPHVTAHGYRTECAQCRAARLQAERDAQTARDREFYARTGSCGGCGSPGDWCQCTEAHACGCRDLHDMGSGVGVDAAEAFSDVPVSDEQQAMF